MPDYYFIELPAQQVIIFVDSVHEVNLVFCLRTSRYMTFAALFTGSTGTKKKSPEEIRIILDILSLRPQALLHRHIPVRVSSYTTFVFLGLCLIRSTFNIFGDHTKSIAPRRYMQLQPRYGTAATSEKERK